MNRDEFEFGFDPEEEQEARRPKAGNTGHTLSLIHILRPSVEKLAALTGGFKEAYSFSQGIRQMLP